MFQRFFGSSNDRKVKAMTARVAKINALEPKMQALSDAELRAQDRRVPRRGWPRARPSTTSWRKPSPSCARPRSRTLGQRHYDVQLVGGMVLHAGRHLRDADR